MPIKDSETDMDAISARVNRTVHENDSMLHGPLDQAHIQSYLRIGNSALRAMRAAMAAAGSDAPRAILDFGCGWGRVARWLQAAFPDAAIEGCDIDANGTGFVAETFGIPTWQAPIVPEEIRPGRQYDLVWAGSVLTHISAEHAERLLARLFSLLRPRGLLVVTTHGRLIEQWVADGAFEQDPERDLYLGAARDCRAVGYGYRDYPGCDGLGVSVTRPQWLFDWAFKDRERRVVSYIERGWNDHQDVFAVERRA